MVDACSAVPGQRLVRRLKKGIPSVHPLGGPEIRALRQLQRETASSSYLFTTERGGPMTTAGFRKMLSRCGELSVLTFPIHPHMLRHACGYKLANDGQDTRAIQHDLGHKNIQHRVRYTELSSERFKGSGMIEPDGVSPSSARWCPEPLSRYSLAHSHPR